MKNESGKHVVPGWVDDKTIANLGNMLGHDNLVIDYREETMEKAERPPLMPWTLRAGSGVLEP